MAVMPMFPLGSVLMPAMPLNLRIFEERYLKLLGDLLGEETPEFGVVLIERGQEVGGGEKRMGVGTIASVNEIGTTDEFYGLQSVGSRRFRVNAWLPDDPYPVADIDFLPDLIWDDNLMPARVHLETKVRRLLAFASEFGDLQYGADVQFSDDPMEACWQLAGVLPVGQLDQLDLLQSQSAEDLIAQTNEIVNAANQSLEQMMTGIDEQPED
uniref:LON peptidase substrate-binding domain-containing protein n=1 Tax=Aquiluna sp. TaxID=2053504 RepID=UPI004048D695